MELAEVKAPCVAVVGPPNSGKSTLLHLLDEALQLHPARPSVYVIKGNPDGSGRYQYYSPELREGLKPEVKGRWIPSTIDQICEWVTEGRRNLELALLDFGGKHTPENHRMLSLCTHYIVLARRFDSAEVEAAEGAESWRAVCEQNGLKPVAVVESLWQKGACQVREAPGPYLEASFRADAAAPGDLTNGPLIAALAASLLALRVKRDRPSAAIDLNLGRDWSPSDLGTIAGLLPHITATARSGGAMLLSGRAPMWAYLAAMHRALSWNPAGTIVQFDPKVGWIGIPLPGGEGDPGFPADALGVKWTASERPGFCMLNLSIRTPDKFLAAAVHQLLRHVPLPAGAPPAAKVVVSGAAPIWLHMTYSRWLRSLAGVTTIALWDARNTTEIVVHSS